MKVQEDSRARDAFGAFLDARGYHPLADDEKNRLWEAFAWAWVPEQPLIRFVLDGPPAVPGEKAGRFVEAEDADGRSIDAGRWYEDSRGRWVLEVAPSRGAPSPPA